MRRIRRMQNEGEMPQSSLRERLVAQYATVCEQPLKPCKEGYLANKPLSVGHVA